MAVVPEAAFRALLADCSRSTFAAFVADLWRARGYEVHRDGDRLVVDDDVLLPATDAGRPPPEDGRLVVATLPGDASAAVGPGALHGMLLYDVERDRAAALFKEHFGRPLDDDWSDLLDDRPTGGPAAGTAGPPGPADDELPPVVPAAVRSLLLAASGRLPRDRTDLRAAARDRRVLAAVAAAAVLSAAGWWGAFVHHPAPDTPAAVPFEAADSDLPVDGPYRVTAAVRFAVDGETFSVAGERTYVPGDPSVVLHRWTYGGSQGRTTVVRYERTGSYTRQTWTNRSDYRSFRDARAEDPSFVRAVDVTKTVYTADRDGTGAEAVVVSGVPLSVLAQLPYERRGTTRYAGRTVVRYVPETGWATRSYGLLDDRRTTWVRTASGEVLVDPDDGTVLHADVAATVVDAATWWGALTGPGTDLTVRYSVQPGVERPEPPPWVDGLAGQTQPAT